jgi:hypothetical protein
MNRNTTDEEIEKVKRIRNILGVGRKRQTAEIWVHSLRIGKEIN